MEGGFILCFAAVMLFMAPGVKGTSHLAFNATRVVNITRAGCGETKHCVATPADCDPEGSATCLFGSVVSTAPVAPNGTTATIQLSGNSSGYIALGLTADATQGTTMLFICAQLSMAFKFSTFQRLNVDGSLVAKEITVKEIRGKVNGTLIQCEFEVPGLNASSTRNSQDSRFQVLMGSGTFTSGVPGPFNIALTSALLDLSQPNATTTTATPTTAGASSVLHSYALLLLLSVVALSFTHRA